MNIKQQIDHSYLKPFTKPEDVKRVCEEAIINTFKAVCIPPYFVKDAVFHTKDSDVKVATVVGFPYGYSATPAKVEEIKRALDEGVDEIDAVINIAAVKSSNWSYVENDIDSMTRAVHLRGKVIKIIFETSLLTEEEIKKLCEICNEVGCNFVKTSTGTQEDVTVDMVQLLRSLLKEDIKIKASGGIKTRRIAVALIEAGADRLGSSNSLYLID